MTRADVIRRLGDAIGPDQAFCTCDECLPRVLDALRAIAREPGGAEAVAEAVGVRAELICEGTFCLGFDAQKVYARIVVAEPDDRRGL